MEVAPDEQLLVDGASLRKAVQLINKLTKELDIERAMESVRDVALELLDCERVMLFLVIGQELRGKTGCEEACTIRLRFGEGIAGTVAQNGELLNIPDAYSHPLFCPASDRAMRFTTRSVLCGSICDHSNKTIAVLQALNKHAAGTFTKVDEQMIQLFGVHLGNTLAKARLFEQAKREKERLTTLSKFFKALNASASLNDALDIITDAVKELVHAQHVVVLLVDTARQVLWTSVSSQRHGSPRLLRVQIGEGLIGTCAADKQQLALCFPPDAAQTEPDPTLLELHGMLAPAGSQLSHVLLQPVLDSVGANVMAVLCALNKSERSSLLHEDTFTPNDCEALSVFSMEVSDVLAARAVEVSFASALSVVSAAAASAMSSALKSQLLDYAPVSSLGAADTAASLSLGGGGSGGGASSGGGGGGAAGTGLLHHCKTIAVPGSRRSSSLIIEGLDGVGSFGGSSLASPSLTPIPSFHHRVPSLPGADRGGRADAERLRLQLLDWGVDTASLSREALVRLAFDLFTVTGVLEELSIPHATLSAFLSAISSQYRDTPVYHQLSHAVSVLHAVVMMLETTSARSILSAGEELVLLIAALSHDVDHDGRTNAFHVNSQSPLAQRYNDRSVQENHHCALTCAVLAQPGCNLFAPFTGREFFAARSLLIDAILATDMHHHFELVHELTLHPLAFNAASDADRALLVRALLHAADLSNHVRPFPIALASAERVHAEFRNQVACERAQALPVAPHMDAPAEPSEWSKIELQFIDYIAVPLWERLGQMFPPLAKAVEQLRSNRAKFLEIARSSPQGSSRAAKPGQPPPEQPADGGVFHRRRSACTEQH